MTSRQMYELFHTRMNSNEMYDVPFVAKQPEKDTQDYVVQHFYRTFTRKATKDKVGYPSYLVNFKAPVLGELEANMQLLKTGEYDLSEEEVLLTKLGTLIGIDNK